MRGCARNLAYRVDRVRRWLDLLAVVDACVACATIWFPELHLMTVGFGALLIVVLTVRGATWAVLRLPLPDPAPLAYTFVRVPSLDDDCPYRVVALEPTSFDTEAGTASVLAPFVQLSEELGVGTFYEELHTAGRYALYTRWAQWNPRAFFALTTRAGEAVAVSILLPLTQGGYRQAADNVERRRLIDLGEDAIARPGERTFCLLWDTLIVRTRAYRDRPAVAKAHHGYVEALVVAHIAQFWDPRPRWWGLRAAPALRVIAEVENVAFAQRLQRNFSFTPIGLSGANKPLFALTVPFARDRSIDDAMRQRVEAIVSLVASRRR
jgi:hypothetical protein